MKIVGVPALLYAQRQSSLLTTLRRSADSARTELTTGRIADLQGELGGRIGGAFNARGALESIAFQKQSLAKASLIATTTQRVLTSIGDGAAALAAEALAAAGRRDETALAAAAVEARSRVQNIFAQLNTRIGGEALFAGDATDGPALSSAADFLSAVESIYATSTNAADFAAGLDAYFDDPAGPFQTIVYVGGAGDAPSIEVGRSERLSFTLRADDASVKEILRGLSAIAAAAGAPPSALRDGALNDGAIKAISGENALTARRAEIGAAERRAAEAAEGLEAEEVVLTEAFNSLAARDPYEAAARLQSLESQLQASLVLAARLSQLTLVNFLR